MRPTVDSIVKSFQNSGKKHFLLTGNRGIGKTTLFIKLKEVLCKSQEHPVPEIMTYLVPQEKVMLRNVWTKEEAVIGIFKDHWMETVSEGFKNLGVRSVKDAIEAEETEWAAMDEIGFLESREESFKDAIRQLFDTKRVLAVIRKQDLPFLNELKNREDVYLVDLDEMRLNVGCVIMASGVSKRFGENKLLIDFQGETLIERVLKLSQGELFARRVVVTRTKEVEALCKEKGIDVIFHAFPGRGDAVRLGMEQMMDLDGCMFCPCDQPFLYRKSLNRMVGKFTYGEKKIFQLGFENVQGSPVLFSKEYFEELKQLPKKSGGSYVIKKHPEEVDVIEAESAMELHDMDTKEDYYKMLFMEEG